MPLLRYASRCPCLSHRGHGLRGLRRLRPGSGSDDSGGHDADCADGHGSTDPDGNLATRDDHADDAHLAESIAHGKPDL